MPTAMKTLALTILASCMLAGGAFGEGAESAPLTAKQVAFFESKIRPVLAEYCYQCHSSEEKVRGGLTLNTRAGLRHGQLARRR